MYSLVKRLRNRGVRKHDREIQTDPGMAGDMTLALCSGGCELKLAADDGSRQEPMLRVLYEARVITMNGSKMPFRGEGADRGVRRRPVFSGAVGAGAGRLGQSPLIMPASEGALGYPNRNTPARRKHLCGALPERSFHAQCFGNGCGGGAVLAAVMPRLFSCRAATGGMSGGLRGSELALQLLDVAHYLACEMNIPFHCIDSLLTLTTLTPTRH